MNIISEHAILSNSMQGKYFLADLISVRYVGKVATLNGPLFF